MSILPLSHIISFLFLNFLLLPSPITLPLFPPPLLEMPCILKIRVVGARDLPVMDKASDLTDAYVEVRFADFEAQRTTVCRKTLNPVWNEVNNKPT